MKPTTAWAVEDQDGKIFVTQMFLNEQDLLDTVGKDHMNECGYRAVRVEVRPC